MLDLMAAGWFALYIDQDQKEGGFNFQLWPLANVYCDTTRTDGVIDIVYRCYELTAEQVINTFEEASEKIKKQAEREPNAKLKLIHAIYPRNDGKVGEGGVALSDASISILAGGGLEKEEKPLVNDENKEEDKEEKQGEYDFLEDKFRVLNPDNTVNLEMSAEKMANSYKSLASRLGTGDVPPKSADEYNIKIESETLNFDDFKKDPENQEFLSKALERGMTSKQVEFVLNEYARVMPAAFDRFKGLTIEQAHSELNETWKTEAEFKSNIKDAFTAFNKYASPEDKERMDEIGNNPVVIRLLANMGKNLREDAPPAKNTGLEPDNVEKIMRSDAYRDPRHPDYKEAQRKVREFYQEKYGNAHA